MRLAAPHSFPLVLLTSIALIASGCAVQHAYPGPERAPAALALLAVERSIHQRLYLERVDDVRIGWTRDRVALLPGTHDVVATIHIRTGSRELSVRHHLEFEARAGHAYRLSGDWGFYGPDLRVIDEATGAEIAKAWWRPGRPDLPPVGTAPR